MEAKAQPHHTTTVLRPFFRDHPGELVPEENFWTLWCKGRLTEADTQTVRPARHAIWTNQCPPPPSLHFLQAGCSSCRPTNSVKALKYGINLGNLCLIPMHPNKDISVFVRGKLYRSCMHSVCYMVVKSGR